MRVSVPIAVNGSLNGCRCKQVKIPISADKKVYVLPLRYQIMKEFVKAVVDLRSTLNAPMPEKTDCVDIHNSNPVFTFVTIYYIPKCPYIQAQTDIILLPDEVYNSGIQNGRGGFMEVGKKLHKLRENKKMSMYRLTQITGVSGHHIKGIEEGTRQPTIETLNRLAVALGSSLAELFNDDSECTYLSENERHLIENYRRLTGEKADALLNMSDVLNK